MSSLSQHSSRPGGLADIGEPPAQDDALRVEDHDEVGETDRHLSAKAVEDALGFLVAPVQRLGNREAGDRGDRIGQAERGRKRPIWAWERPI